jgi:hypothetical protein
VNADVALLEFGRRGVKVELGGDALPVTGADLLTDLEIECLREIKSELVAWLLGRPDGWSAADWQALFDVRGTDHKGTIDAVAHCRRRVRASLS